jgi:hypothetical protein
LGHGLTTKRAWRSAEHRLETLIKTAKTAEARGHRDLSHGQTGLVQQLLGQVHASCLSDGNGRSAKVFAKQPPQLPFPDPQPVGQGDDVAPFVAGALLD